MVEEGDWRARQLRVGPVILLAGGKARGWEGWDGRCRIKLKMRARSSRRRLALRILNA
jgi:hypothetical protein